MQIWMINWQNINLYPLADWSHVTGDDVGTHEAHERRRPAAVSAIPDRHDSGTSGSTFGGWGWHPLEDVVEETGAATRRHEKSAQGFRLQEIVSYI